MHTADPYDDIDTLPLPLPTPPEAVPHTGAQAGTSRILVIDDNASVLDAFRKILAGTPDQDDTRELLALEATLFGEAECGHLARPGFLVDLVCDGEQGCDRAHAARHAGIPYTMAFVDMRMPTGWDGLRTVRELWRVDEDLQVVICTAYTDHAWDDVVAQLGRNDRVLVLRKPFEPIEVLQMARALSEKWKLERRQAARIAQLESDALSRMQELERRANFDALTGLANRGTLHTRVMQALADSRRHQRKAAMMFVDLDRFKHINDSLSHSAGDDVLIEVSRRLKAAVRETDVVARLGGDEFAIFITDLAGAPDAATVASKALRLVGEPMKVEGQEIRPCASIGISLYPEDGDRMEALLKNADLAMYHAKSLGGARFRFFAADMNTRIAARFSMETDLRRGIGRGELLLHYQPQVSLVTGAVTGAEALARWHHPQKGPVAPSEFIRLAEDTGLIQPLGEWVLNAACAQLRAWLDNGVSVPSVSVNLSVRQFLDGNLVPQVQRALRTNRVDPRLLELEVTETAVMHDADTAMATVRQLKKLGVRISLDDFGTGYSSLGYLKRFTFDHLKIDRSFVKDITVDPDDAAICDAVIGLAHNLGLTVIAEGVETEQQLVHLRRRGCDEIQGFCFSKPLPANDFAALLRANRKLALPAMTD